MLILSLPLKLRWIIPFLFLTSKLEKTANSLPQFVASLHSVPNSYKYALIFILLHRAFKLFSDFELLHQEIEHLNNIFRKTSQTARLTNFYIKKYLDNL